MAPDTVAKWLDDLPQGSVVVDPMCGSGVVLRQAMSRGHTAQGFDIDPLAVLMSRVWTGKHCMAELPRIAAEIVLSKGDRRSHLSMPTVNVCPETRAFIEYWFSEPQRSALARISLTLFEKRDLLPKPILDGLLVALSRTIITKQFGASLAWDVSHSRPHRKRDTNPFDVRKGFVRAADKLFEILAADPVMSGSAKVQQSDCRDLVVKTNSADAVITSPPYLNAIDYLRGHKLALVWMGYTIPQLRDLRATSIGTERAGKATAHANSNLLYHRLSHPTQVVQDLPLRQQRIVEKYAEDSNAMLVEMKRVLKPGGRLVVVLADSVVRGIEVRTSEIYAREAINCGFKIRSREVRELQADRRYLPINSTNKAMSSRMRKETIQVFST
jgi:DNA modification methylase